MNNSMVDDYVSMMIFPRVFFNNASKKRHVDFLTRVGHEKKCHVKNNNKTLVKRKESIIE